MLTLSSHLPFLPRIGYLSRTSLLSRLDEGVERRVILITAPAGYGKTTLLSHWARLLRQKYPLAWCALESEDAHLARFISHFFLSLTPLFPNIEEKVGEILRSHDVSPKAAFRVLLSHLYASTHPVFIILDDMHYIDSSPDIIESIDMLVRNAPPSLHLVLSTRRFPQIPSLIQLHLQGEILRLTAEDLAFTPEESTHLLRDVFGLDVASSQIEQIYHKTEGWPIALHLIARLIQEQHLPPAENIGELLPTATRDLYNYLLHVILAGQPPHILAFLYRTSIVDMLTPPLCALLTGEQNALSVLSYLEESGLFTFPEDDERTHYRYHALFREFLRRRLQEEMDDMEIRALHRRAGSYFLAQEDEEHALYHFLSAGDYTAALALFRSMWATFLHRKRTSQVEEWLTYFPKELREQDPVLILSQAKLALLHGDVYQADRLYRKFESLADEVKDIELLLHYYRGRLGIYKRQGKFSDAFRVAKEALSYVRDPGEEAEFLASMAYARYLVDGPTTEVFALLHKAKDRSHYAKDAFVRGRILKYIGNLYAVMGNLIAAIHVLQDAVSILEHAKHRYPQIFILDNISYYHYLVGNLETAELLVNRAAQIARYFGLEDEYGGNIKALIRAARGDFQEARAYHEKALRIQVRQNNFREVPVTMNWLGLLARLEGQLEEALYWGEQSLSRREALGEQYEIGLSLIDLGATHMARGELQAAERLWGRAFDIFSRFKAQFELTQLHFYLAYLAYVRGQEEMVRLHLEQSMKLAKTYEHGTPTRCLHFYTLEKSWTAPLMAYALKQKIVPECAKCLLVRLGQDAFRALLPLLDAEEADVRVRAVQTLADIRLPAALRPLYEHRHDPAPEVRKAIGRSIAVLLQIPPEPLRVQTLGGFHLWRAGREITKWPRRSARDMFIFLLHHTPHPVPSDMLMEALWPGASPIKAAQRLRRATSDLRHVLEPELPPTLSSRYIRVKEGTYTLLLPEGSYVDVMEFERKIKEARSLVARGAAAQAQEQLEEALTIYQGDYLPEWPYVEWLLQRREHVRRQFGDATRLLARLYMHSQDVGRAIHYAQRALSVDPYDEEAIFILIHSYIAEGRAAKAALTYRSFEKRLQQDLGVSPGPHLLSLYKQIRTS